MPVLAMGIDQSLSCTGVVLRQVEDDGTSAVVYSQTISTSKDPSKSPIADTIIRSKIIADKLLDIQICWQPDYIALENLSYGSVGNATRNLAILFGVICTTMGLNEPSVVPPTTLKKFATGNGKASKKEMYEAIDREDPAFYNFLTNVTLKGGRHDLADAFWIAKWIDNENRKKP